jgi:uncharacterized membrane protein YfcA
MWIVYPLLFLGGFVDSISGGGGLISLSAFLAVGIPPHLALGTNKFSVFLGTAMSTFHFAKSGNIEWKAAGIATAGALAGSAIGARTALWVDGRTLSIVMLALIPLVAIFLVLKRDFGSGGSVPAGWKYGACAFLIGLIIGWYTGFFGPGAGTFFIMAFTLLMGAPLLIACGNTKVVNLASNIAAVATFVAAGPGHYVLALPVALCSILGNHVGARMAIKNGARLVRPMMVVVVCLLLVKIAADFLQ